MTVTMKNSVFGDMTPCGCLKIRTLRRNSTLPLVLPASVVPSSLILFTLMTEAKRSSVVSVLSRTTGRHIPEDGILLIHRRENLKSYIALTGCAL
jgi:hypothetical protein